MFHSPSEKRPSGRQTMTNPFCISQKAAPDLAKPDLVKMVISPPDLRSRNQFVKSASNWKATLCANI
ncbi:MAG: hypothetical protein DI586_02965 [Micavibrio aeruginosavorus]|uniref:Uncharacterized protein n=1 Tax=Micavibrio aeruginosavorus TaxID=349221 RepID=A0A2W5HSM7_9BACT|nr:MAG: hypothetical protein DI586_02965 [Micavibrio aeruginosavorus]